MIPFMQYLRPDWRKRAEAIERPAEIEVMGHEFIARGGWFECEVLSTGDVSLTACWNMPDGDNDIEIEIAPNGSEVPAAVDRLVTRAAGRTDLPPLEEAS